MNEISPITDIWIDHALSSKWIPVWIFLAGVFIFSIGYRPEFIGFQTRFGLFAKEMFGNGISFFPTTYGYPYPDYPAMSTILIWLFSLIPGKVTPLTAILPTAITSSLILVFIYKIGALKDRKWGLYAVLIALMTYDFVKKSRSVSLDQYSSLMTVLCFYTVYSASLTGRTRRLWWVPLFFVMGFLFRGPIGLVIPAAVTGVYYLWKGDYKKLIATGIVSASLLAVCFAALLWAARIQGGESFAQRVFDAQVGGRVAGEGRKPVYYYVLYGFTYYSAAYPLALLVLICKFKDMIKHRHDHAFTLGYFALWMAVILAGFTFISTKAMRYTLPFIPAISLLGAYLFISESPTGTLLSVKKVFLGFCYYLPIITLCAAFGYIGFSLYHGYSLHWFHIVTFVALVCLFIGARRVEKGWSDHYYKNLAALGIGASALITLQAGVIEPFQYAYEQTTPFAEKTTAMAQQYNKQITFLEADRDGEAIKFMANLGTTLSPKFVSSASNLPEHPDDFYVISLQDFKQLPDTVLQRMKVLYEGRIGHREYAAITSLATENINE